MDILVFGSSAYEPDSLPLKILPNLRRRLPDDRFLALDPNEEWEVSGDLTVIDTVINLTEPTIFRSLDAFRTSPRCSTHDFDALAQLRLLSKLGRIGQVTVIGLPPRMNEAAASDFVAAALTKS
ncbi:hypothetical protein COY93_01640 [Candidatus Uhrbacteria bacterium CG_4_10_14_0_8_um_filter_58_22]|uniref:Uncharacterized protein n=1 Tax=Candidatus Uhrbacteria bacterium CG_4_10_14_0_8_um_filter_58_22 TaxID=1975029 RepID=A0A2M7QB85_9BACT|nr:MAG: hypothetical protein AUJ19_03360 [Parcubacteria group bacterium CG1_02_58_44]PIY62987.1 MAG: hypothetical protein COY93_01640 [Candidatus Uhrbacteria bacterium CG_4_10_14_0_8_um_filter_58_22]